MQTTTRKKSLPCVELLAGKCVKKEQKRCGILKSKVGAEGPRTDCVHSQSTLGETELSRWGSNTAALWSLNRETPATTTQEFGGGSLHHKAIASGGVEGIC
jgi:hypothetical protein